MAPNDMDGNSPLDSNTSLGTSATYIVLPNIWLEVRINSRCIYTLSLQVIAYISSLSSLMLHGMIMCIACSCHCARNKMLL